MACIHNAPMSGDPSRLTLPCVLTRADSGDERAPSARRDGRGSPFFNPLRQFFPGPGSLRRFFLGFFSSGAGEDAGAVDASSAVVEACRSRSGGPWCDADADEGCSQSYVFLCCAVMVFCLTLESFDVSFASALSLGSFLPRFVFCFFAGGDLSFGFASSSEDEYVAISRVCFMPSLRRMGGGDCDFSSSRSSASRCCMPGRSWSRQRLQ